MKEKAKLAVTLPGRDEESKRIREVATHEALKFCQGLPVTIETLLDVAEKIADFIAYGDVPIKYTITTTADKKPKIKKK